MSAALTSSDGLMIGQRRARSLASARARSRFVARLRLVLIAMTLAMIALGPTPLIGLFTGFDFFVGAVGVLLICLFAVQTASVARKLALEEPAVKFR